jgi:hypothetical protein
MENFPGISKRVAAYGTGTTFNSAEIIRNPIKRVKIR